MRRRILGVFLASLVLLSGVAPAAMAAGGSVNYSADAPNPYLEADTTVDSYKVAWGDSLKYEADDGSVETLPATLNRSTDPDELGNGTVNPFTFAVTDINFSDADEFPRKSEEDNAASALDASEWTTSGASVSDTTTAPGVDAVDYTASAAGDSATYSNFSITSDAEKRYFQAFYDVTDASGASVVNVTIHDATDGDTAVVELYNATGNTDDVAVGANSTGEGKAMQVQIGKLDATGGDNTIQEISKIVVEADGAATVKTSALNLEKTGKWTLGVTNVDTDTDDDDLETETVYEATGPLSLDSINSMGPAFDNAEIKGLTFPAQFDAKRAADENVNATFAQDNAYPQWDAVLTEYVRLELPSAYDLSYANADLKMEQKWAETRYVEVSVAEATSDDNEMHEVDSSKFSDVTSSFSSEGDTHTLDSTVSVGENYDIKIVLKLTGDEASAMQSAMSGGAGIMGGGSGGFFDWIIGLPGVVLAGAVAVIGRMRGVF